MRKLRAPQMVAFAIRFSLLFRVIVQSHVFILFVVVAVDAVVVVFGIFESSVFVCAEKKRKEKRKRLTWCDAQQNYHSFGFDSNSETSTVGAWTHKSYIIHLMLESWKSLIPKRSICQEIHTAKPTHKHIQERAHASVRECINVCWRWVLAFE